MRKPIDRQTDNWHQPGIDPQSFDGVYTELVDVLHPAFTRWQLEVGRCNVDTVTEMNLSL